MPRVQNSLAPALCVCVCVCVCVYIYIYIYIHTVYIYIYGCEVWTLKVRERKRMGAVEVNCLRNICGLRRIDRVPNVEIRRCGKNVSVRELIKVY